MAISKIGSKNTYHKCIRELSTWNYIKYAPTQNPFKSSEVSLYNYGTSTVPNGINNGTSTEQVLYPFGTKIGTSTGILYKHNKHINNNKQEPQFSDFLKVKKNKNYNEPL